MSYTEDPFTSGSLLAAAAIPSSRAAKIPRVVSKSHHHHPRANNPLPRPPAPLHPPKYCLNPLPQLSCKLERIEHGDKSSQERRRGDSSSLQTRFSLFSGWSSLHCAGESAAQQWGCSLGFCLFRFTGVSRIIETEEK